MLLIADKDGNEIFLSDIFKDKYDDRLRINALKSIPETSESGFIVIDNTPSITVFYSGLNKYGLRTVSFMPNNFIYTDFEALKKIVIKIFSFVICVSLAISYFISQKLYNPVRSLLFNIVRDNSTTTNEIIKSKDEFSLIENNYNSVVKQNLEINERLSENLPLLKELFLRNILEGKINDIRAISNKAEFLGMDIKNAVNFTVYVILIENTEINVENTFQLQYLKQTFNNIIKSELNSKNIEILYNFTDDDMLILINWDNQSSKNAIYIPERINIAIKRQFESNVDIYISIGLTVNNITDLSYSYITAIDAINYIGKKSNIIYANDIVHLPRTANYLIANDEKQLLLSILNYDRKRAIDIFNKIINDILDQNVSYEYFQQM